MSGQNLKVDLTIGTHRYIVAPMDKEAMDKRYPFWMPLELYERAQTKAGLIPLAAVIRRLLEKWLRDEVELETQERKGR